MESELTVGQCATLACLLEVTAPKPGNVHRGADFEDLEFHDFVVSAVGIAPAMQAAAHQGVGQTVLDAIRATRSMTPTNTNLGTVLLLAPMAAIPRETPLTAGLNKVLAELTGDDSRAIYQAIRLAQPGGMGQVEEMDVASSAPCDILLAMQAAAQRDLVACQYVNGFEQVLETVLPALVDGQQSGLSLTAAIIYAHVVLMARHPDSLIARKCGVEMAAQSARRAAAVLEAGPPDGEAYHRAISDLDFWLRSDGHRRNPGTTADLVAAALFGALRDGLLRKPYR